MANIIEEKNMVLPGHTSCPGCAGPILHRMIFNLIGKNVIQFGRGGCGTPSVVSHPMIYFSHSSAGGTGATGIVHALKIKEKNDTVVVGLAGDGGASDTGFGKVSGCAIRNDDMLFFCYDNEAFMNTGIQQSRQTPYKAWTRTTPGGKISQKKDMPMIIAQHHVPYVATLSIAHVPDLIKKIKKGLKINGFKYYHSLNPCPTGWRSPPNKTIELVRLGVQSWIWPLFEIENGIFRLTMTPKEISINKYLKLQGRFAHLNNQDTQEIQEMIDKKRERMIQMDGKNIWM